MTDKEISRRSFLLGIPAVAAVPVAAMIAAPAEAAGFKLRGVIATPTLLEEVQRIADANAARAATAMGQPIAKVARGERVSIGPPSEKVIRNLVADLDDHNRKRR